MHYNSHKILGGFIIFVLGAGVGWLASQLFPAEVRTAENGTQEIAQEDNAVTREDIIKETRNATSIVGIIQSVSGQTMMVKADIVDIENLPQELRGGTELPVVSKTYTVDFSADTPILADEELIASQPQPPEFQTGMPVEVSADEKIYNMDSFSATRIRILALPPQQE